MKSRRQIKSLLAGEKRILEMIASGASLPVVLEALVRLIEEQAPEMLGSVLVLDEDGKRLLHGAAPSLPESYNRAVDGLVIGPDAGSCGTAAYRKKAVIVSDVASDPLWTRYRALALEHGLRACWSTPIFSRSGRVLGTFAMYYRERRSPSRSDLELIRTATHLAGIAIHNSQLYEAILYQAAKLAAANEEIAKANIKMKAEIAERKRLEKEVLGISNRERQRIGQDLHDGLGQELTGIAFLAKGLEEGLRRRSLGEAAEAEKITRLVNEAICHARALARGLFPVPVEANGLMSALEELAGSVRSVFRIDCEFRCERPVLFNDNGAATHLYRIAQEAVDNAIKHGKATEITIELSGNNGTGGLTVADNGGGMLESAAEAQGFGLRIMKYRAEMIQGSLEIRPQGRGTVVRCSFRPTQPSEAGNHGGTSAAGS